MLSVSASKGEAKDATSISELASRLVGRGFTNLKTKEKSTRSSLTRASTWSTPSRAFTQWILARSPQASQLRRLKQSKLFLKCEENFPARKTWIPTHTPNVKALLGVAAPLSKHISFLHSPITQSSQRTEADGLSANLIWNTSTQERKKEPKPLLNTTRQQK